MDRSKIARSRTMLTATHTLDRARSFADMMVRAEWRRHGSKMRAYAEVADLVGKSPSWLRKLLGRADGIAIGAHEYLNIAAAYAALCERIEAAAAHERAITARLQEAAHAALASDPRLHHRGAGATGEGTGAAASIGAVLIAEGEERA